MVQMDPAKVQGVADWSPPQNVTNVRAFLGFTGFYRYFVPNYSLIARPLIQLTRKNTPFIWDQDCRRAFENLKTLMCNKPILRQPDYTKAFFLATDASRYSVGAVLSQEGEINPCTNKPMLCSVAYFSATFTPTERNYPIYECEFLGMYKAIKRFRPHIAATTLPVTILTDHANLTYWKAPHKVNRRVARWFTDLQDYNLVIKHVPGKIHTAPDMLSRPPGVDRGLEDNADIVLLPSSMFISTADSETLTLKEKVLQAQNTQGSEMEHWCDTQGVRKLPEGYAKEWRLAVPAGLKLRREIVSHFHDSPIAGHPGRDNTIALTSQHYWWPGMNTWIERYVAGCARCQQAKIRTTKKKVPLYRIPGDALEQPFHTIAMDLITQLPKANGQDAILTIVDQGCSRAALFLPCQTTITGEGIALLYLQHLFPWFGMPAKVISDRDPRFTSNFAKALTQKLGITQNISTAFHPQTDGLTERKNQWVEQYLRLYTSARQDDWEQWLPLATFVHNRWPNATTKQSPHEVLLGYQPSATQGLSKPTNNEAAENRQQLIKEHRTAAVQALNQVASAKPPTQHKVGDQVWLEAKHLTLPYASAKLAPKRHGPFQIVKEISPVAYQLELPKAWTIHNVFHSSILTPYKETDEHGGNYQRPPPEMIDNAEEYEVELIINHRYHGKRRQLQYLICWKGYSAADDTWEPADQVHAPALVKRYHQRHPLDTEGYKGRGARQTKSTTTISKLTAPTCRPPLHSLLAPLPAPAGTKTLQFPSLQWLRPQWSTSRNGSAFPKRSWRAQMSSVSSNSPSHPAPHVLPLK